MRDTHKEIANERIELFVFCLAFDNPKTIPKEMPSSNKVTEKVTIFLLTISQVGTPMFIQMMSSGSGAL